MLLDASTRAALATRQVEEVLKGPPLLPISIATAAEEKKKERKEKGKKKKKHEQKLKEMAEAEPETSVGAGSPSRFFSPFLQLRPSSAVYRDAVDTQTYFFRQNKNNTINKSRDSIIIRKQQTIASMIIRAQIANSFLTVPGNRI